MRHQELHPYTIIINKKQKNLTRKARYDALAWLTKKFPKVFDTSISIQPLKCGIMTDILVHAEEAKAEGISKSKLREAVVMFTRRIDYLTCLKSRETRVDLQGNPVTEVTEEEAFNAALKIKRHIEKNLKNSKKNGPLSSFISEKKYDAEISETDVSESMNKNERSTPYIFIKQKNIKNYKSEAIIRLKEKLGLVTAKQ